MPVIKIRIERGAVVSVEAPRGTDVEIYDYDTEGADPTELQQDESGVPVFLTEYAGKEEPNA